MNTECPSSSVDTGCRTICRDAARSADPRRAPTSEPAKILVPGLVCSNLWQAFADHHLDAPPPGTRPLVQTEPLDIGAIRDGQVVFVKTDLLDLFVRRALPRLQVRNLTLVTGQSDLSPSEYATSGIHAAWTRGVISTWLGVNFTSVTHVQKPLPLGLTVPDLPHGAQDVVLGAVRGVAPTDGRDVLMTHQEPTHPIRAALGGFDHERLARVSSRQSYEEYIATVASYPYVLCPRGNGVDVHRVYEAVLVGTVPIYVSDDVPPAIYSQMPVVVCCSSVTLARTLAALPRVPQFGQEAWRRSRLVCTTGHYITT